ncbi:UDP-N-acetylmuramate--L-alanine ligase [Patescibacteria group bacterium]|nr:UDP-N-acetylmuramate--L-alanine ligase [Patescibacteria group bacterium]
MKVHFIGIGGIGVSALAQYYLAKGHKVSGSDLVSSEITEFLEQKGVKLLPAGRQVPKDVDLVIYSPAIKLKKKTKKYKSYPEALGELTKKYFTIAVSGTHGKSTTCAMIALILMKAGFDPTVIVGTKLREFNGSNFRMGKDKYLVIEADEWQASFLNYWPKIIVLNNIEREHLDYYKGLGHILHTYREYIEHLPKDGILIANRDDRNILKLQFKARNYSIKQKEAKKISKILKVPGEHNIYNALAALAVARALKIPDKISFKALSGYKGAWRRFEIKRGEIGNKKFTIISDYAHHPTEIKATLEAAREKFPSKKIWCIFQPHQYQRTFYLFNDFIRVFSEASIDKLIITDIYDVAGRERKKIKKKINSRKLIKEIKKAQAIYLPKERIKNYLRRNLRGREVVIIMGAGDIYKFAEGFSTGQLDIVK